jgi:hypothetical protein
VRWGWCAASLIAIVCVASVAIGSTHAGVSHQNPCHSAHTCPSDHHTYLWRGMSCTSYADERETNDTRVVVFAGHKYWCHPGSPAGGKPTTGRSRSVPLIGAPAYWQTASKQVALLELSRLRVRMLGSLRGYARDKYGPPWEDVDHNGCDTRNDILRRDLTKIVLEPGSQCVVLMGKLRDPYTARMITFLRGVKTSKKVQIDHVVAHADAWRTGASRWMPRCSS